MAEEVLLFEERSGRVGLIDYSTVEDALLVLGVVGSLCVPGPAETVGVAVVDPSSVFHDEVEVRQGAQPALCDLRWALHSADILEGGVVGTPPERLAVLQVVPVLGHPEDAGVQLPLRGGPVALRLAELLAPVGDDLVLPVLVLAEDAGDLILAEVCVQGELASFGSLEVREA